MSDQMDLTTVVFALVAMFVVWKMRTILGTRNPESEEGRDRPKPDGKTGSAAPGSSGSKSEAQAGSARWTPFASFGTETWQRLEEISKIDPAFDPRDFVEGAKMAYDVILKSFSVGDLQALQPLLADDVYESFSSAIRRRNEAGQSLETTLVSIDKAEIKDIQLDGRVAQIMIRFASKLISVTRDKQTQEVTEGAPDRVTDVIDIWTFKRDLSSNDPNWRLISTEDAH